MGYLASSVDAPLERRISNASAAGRAFYVNTGVYTVTAGGANSGISVFFTARATKIILVGARGFDSSAGSDTVLRKTTTDPTLSGHSISGIAIQNSLGSGGGATSGGNLSSATEGIGSPGTLHRIGKSSSNSNLSSNEILTSIADYIIIPPNVAGGFILYNDGVSTNSVCLELRWVEL